MAEDSLQTLEIPPPDPSTPRRVFLEVSLKEGLYPMMPHSMYCLPLWSGITLVLITKVSDHSFGSVFSGQQGEQFRHTAHYNIFTLLMQLKHFLTLDSHRCSCRVSV